MRISAVIQARMTSKRVPGKVLAPFLGKPLIANVIDRVKAFDPEMRIVLATSTDTEDDPLAIYVESLGIPVIRGARDDVLGRFVKALNEHPCEAFFRVCADSPLLDHRLFAKAVSVYSDHYCDLVTNVFPRSFPAGMSVELVNSGTFAGIEKSTKNPDDREHITRFFYRNYERFIIHNIRCPFPSTDLQSLAVDEPGDLNRIETMVKSGKVPDFFPLQ
jgi:spore coat polysaccharide biosynthesis protein SpsF